MAARFEFALTNADEVAEKIKAYFSQLQVFVYREVWDPDLPQEEDPTKKGMKIWKEVPDGHKMPGIAGLAFHLGINRRTFLNYITRARDGGTTEAEVHIAHVLTRAKAEIEMHQEAGLFDKEQHRGSAFSLNVNYGWNDNTDDTGQISTFVMNTIPPAARETATAIPHWKPESEDT